MPPSPKCTVAPACSMPTPNAKIPSTRFTHTAFLSVMIIKGSSKSPERTEKALEIEALTSH